MSSSVFFVHLLSGLFSQSNTLFTHSWPLNAANCALQHIRRTFPSTRLSPQRRSFKLFSIITRWIHIGKAPPGVDRGAALCPFLTARLHILTAWLSITCAAFVCLKGIGDLLSRWKIALLMLLVCSKRKHFLTLKIWRRDRAIFFMFILVLANDCNSFIQI